jgi:phosphoglycerate dehydrogenase-like enzyme
MKVLIGPNDKGLEQALPSLRERHPLLEFAHCSAQDALAGEIADAVIYLGWLNRDAFLAAKRLTWVQAASSGIDQYLAIPELATSDVLLTSASGTHGACLAESALAMIFAFTRGLREAVLCQERHQWGGRGIRVRMAELTGSTLGIIGFGVVGQALARRAQAFDARVLALDLFPADKPEYVAHVWGVDRLPDLLRGSDYVVVAVPYTPATHGMIGAEQLALMKPAAILVGISRGKIIDQKALARALREKRLAAAALDVFDQEPLPADSELWDLENLLIAPHIAGGTQLEGQYILGIFRENLERFLRGDMPLRNQIDNRRGF